MEQLKEKERRLVPQETNGWQFSAGGVRGVVHSPSLITSPAEIVARAAGFSCFTPAKRRVIGSCACWAGAQGEALEDLLEVADRGRLEHFENVCGSAGEV
jgi:hypothetical protein